MSQHHRTPGDGPLDYAAAGVDTAAGDRAVELMGEAVARTHGATVLGATGGFAGMVDASALVGMRRPLLATSTDGVGTKIAIAQALGIHDTIGQDLVGMVVDDVVVVGARPLLMTDYIACGHVVPERIAAIVTGIARACASIGCPLVGGETAEHPGLMGTDDYDLAGAATGVVDAADVRGPERVHAGDVLVALASSGLHSNGYSLVRRVVERAGVPLEAEVASFGRTLGEELLEPTRLYTRVCLDLLDDPGVAGDGASVATSGLHALAHVTGGGLAANLARVLPAGLVGVVDRASWVVPPVFDWVRVGGDIAWEALEDSLNLGVGMVAVVAPQVAERVLGVAGAAGIGAWVLGDVRAATRDEGAERPSARSATGTTRIVSGTKGAHGGAVRLVGGYRLG